MVLGHPLQAKSADPAKGIGMFQVKHRLGSLSAVAVLVMGGLSLSACATKDYVDEKVGAVDNHVNALDVKVTDASQKADAANTAAESAQASAQQANQRIDQLSARVDSLEQRIASKKPRN
jgi:murein lipoprotein